MQGISGGVTSPISTFRGPLFDMRSKLSSRESYQQQGPPQSGSFPFALVRKGLYVMGVHPIRQQTAVTEHHHWRMHQKRARDPEAVART